MKRITNKEIMFYLDIVNDQTKKKLEILRCNGITIIHDENFITLFSGTKKQVYEFLVGVSRLLDNVNYIVYERM